MKSFRFNNYTELFWKRTEYEVGVEQKVWFKVLLHYGGGSIKKWII